MDVVELEVDVTVVEVVLEGLAVVVVSEDELVDRVCV